MSAESESRVRAYLAVLALSLPASLLFTAYRGFNHAVSRPKAVMALQVTGLALKVPLSALLIHGLPAIGLPALGVVGCAIATAVVMWSQALIAFAVLRRDPFYARFQLWGQGLHAPDRSALWAQLKLGVPMGMAILIEVSGFALMAVFIARLGTTAVAGHQIVANLVSVLFMVPLGIASATSTDVIDVQRGSSSSGSLTLGNMTLKVSDAGVTTPIVATDELTVFTYQAGVTRSMRAFGKSAAYSWISKPGGN